MIRLLLLFAFLTFPMLGCIESPPPTPVVDADVDMGSDQTSDLVESCDCAEGSYCSDEGGCVECLTNEHCGGATPFCGDSNTCVACRVAEDCGGNLSCEDSQCVGCQIDADCGEILRCDIPTATCVACLGIEDGKDQCPADAPICNADSKMCVRCVGDSTGCEDGLKCKDEGQEESRCVVCRNNEDCGDQQVCNASEICVACDAENPCAEGNCKIDENNPTLNTCVECLDSTTCGADAPTCTNNVCVGCTSVTECSHLGDAYRYCMEGTCRECVGFNEEADCGSSFCDLNTNLCSTIPGGMIEPLGACNSSAECVREARCVPIAYKGTSSSHCMPLVEESGNIVCPGPYGAQKVTRDTVEGVSVLVCMIDEDRTTPAAIAEAGKPCALTGSDCIANGSECRLRNLNNAVCTYGCLFDSDCTSDKECRCAGVPNQSCLSPKFCLPRSAP